ncbi:uncharacterized protein LOC142329563 [Lycorma delicatula]|uniref:uncharacterized protein LOC142329563 n=1 Tax=Lycorma delicatula TaxID=130591 RepID=UPI003F5159DD
MGHRAALPSSLFSFLFIFIIISTKTLLRKNTTVKSSEAIRFYVGLLTLLITMRLNTVHCSQQRWTGCTTTNITKISCVLDSEQNAILTADNFTEGLHELKISGGKNLLLSRDIFYRAKYLKLLYIKDNNNLTISNGTFNNQFLRNRHLNITLININNVYLESYSLKNAANLSISLYIMNAETVVIRPDTFYDVDSVTIRNVTSLQLQSNSFKLMQATTPVPKPKVTFDNVKMKELPGGTFPSALCILTLRNCNIGYVSAEAIKLIMLNVFTIDNCTVDEWGSGTFAFGTYINELHISSSRLKTVKTDAFNLGAGSILTIEHSMIDKIYSGAFNMTVASVSLINNTFEDVKNMGFTLTKETSWTRMKMENNTFKTLHTNAFNAPYIPDEDGTKNGVFIFRRNYINNAAVNTFNLSVPNDIHIIVSDNYFGDECQCSLTNRMKNIFSGVPSTNNNISQLLFETSKCKVTYKISKCYDLPQGFMLMRNFTDSFCDLSMKNCEIFADDEENSDVNKLPFIPPWKYHNEMIKERKVLEIILFIAACCVFVIIISTFIMWLYRNQYFTKGRILLFLSTESLFNLMCRLCTRSSGGVSRSNSAHSISRISVHEYAELHGQKIIQDIEEEILPSEDKGTQTLPEELTQELLQSLREKLDDPENYSEARDMIEHLYDLIKVEESCNKNHVDTSINFDDFDDTNITIENHVYDEIKPSTRQNTTLNKDKTMTPKTKKILVTVGTRAPSPEKLLPLRVAYAENKRKSSLILGDYSEPKDRKNQSHEYSELPGKTQTQNIFLTEFNNDNKISFKNSEENIQLHNSKPIFLLANRPLPEKPDPGEGPSTSST